ncbi:hypothetical protein AURDEDRAFT_183268 [Auricularia subglabra TFB-10046 SS5]|nr:hypothetical protein AURDEDRAFT_183268 [Auricularia subglabra TFB-10046 SS5]
MRFSLSSAAVVVFSVSVGLAATTARPGTDLPGFPKFELLFSTNVNIQNTSTPIELPVGNRFRTSIGGGTVFDARGKKIGQIVSGFGSETGYVDSAGVANLEAKELWHFDDDDHYALTQTLGPARIDGVTGECRGIARFIIETDSPTRSKYNSWLLVTHISGSAPNLHLDIYGADPAALPSVFPKN